ncbi:hypothetical protein chiPu_0009818 [Chiloscyllium punctatum]|uniref:Uncharacterized protein n=1 Tax=Chiloscyllium punctatum TaxID=137246 RepID=A0A401SLV8_CHIPU|nr:hypothetical protein [Chiloscyllium punctatum]
MGRLELQLSLRRAGGLHRTVPRRSQHRSGAKHRGEQIHIHRPGVGIKEPQKSAKSDPLEPPGVGEVDSKCGRMSSVPLVLELLELETERDTHREREREREETDPLSGPSATDCRLTVQKQNECFMELLGRVHVVRRAENLSSAACQSETEREREGGREDAPLQQEQICPMIKQEPEPGGSRKPSMWGVLKVDKRTEASAVSGN